jgi:hypothetical protein
MKKLFFLLFIGVALMAGKAKAQYCDSTVTMTVTDYFPGYNNMDSFSWYVTADGWLNYILTDNGPGGTGYESLIYIGYNSTYINPMLEGGGNMSGSIYIGTQTQDIVIAHDCGWITGPAEDQCSAQEWTVHVVF